VSLFQLREFRLVYGAAVVSWAGDALSFLAFMWLAFTVGGATGVIAVRLADSLPSIVVGLGAGVVADRVDRKRLMVASDLLRAGALALLVAVSLGGRPSVLALALTYAVVRVGDSFFEPAAGAILPDVVPNALIQRANSLFHGTAESLSALALGGAGLLLTVVPIVHFFSIDAATFVGSAALLAFLRTRSRGAGGDRNPLHEVADGVREFTRRPPLGVAMVMFGLGITIGAGIFIPAAPTLVGERLEAGPGSFGVVMLGFSLGAIVMAAVLGRVAVVRRERWSIVSWIGYSVCFALFAVAPNLGVMILGSIAAGAAEAGARILLVSAMQDQIPSALLGRAMSLYSTVHRSAHGLGLITVAFLVTSLPLDEALLIGAGLELVSLCCCLIALRTHRVGAVVHGG
jgi:MFS family permease